MRSKKYLYAYNETTMLTTEKSHVAKKHMHETKYVFNQV